MFRNPIRFGMFKSDNALIDLHQKIEYSIQIRRYSAIYEIGAMRMSLSFIAAAAAARETAWAKVGDVT